MLGILAFLFICLCILIKFISVVISHARTRKFFAHYPQTPTVFLLGETSFFKKSPINHHFIQRLNEIADNFVHGEKIFLSWMGTQAAVFIFNKKYIKQILSKNDSEILSKGAWLYPAIDDVAPNSLLTVPGDRWKTRRKLLSEPFHTTNLDNFTNIVNEESTKLIKNFKINPVCKDIMHEMKKFTLNVFTKLLFEYDLEDDTEELVEIVNDATGLLVRKAFSVYLVSPFLYRFTSLATEEIKSMKKMMAFRNKMLNAKIESSKQSLQSKLENQNNLDTKSSNLTLIEILLKNFKNVVKSKTADFVGFEMDEIRAQLDTFIIAGFDTLSAALLFLFYHLAKYPQFQEQIYNEIQQVVGTNQKSDLTMDQIKKMVFLEAFVHESLRTKPIAPIISRLAVKDLKIDDKYFVPKGTDIVIFIEKVLEDPDYFPEPNVFKPERFLEDQTDNLYVNIPFSAGTRNCVAKKMAFNTLRLLAVNLLLHYKIEFTENTPKEITKSMLKFELVNKPIDDLELKFVKRQ